MVLDRQTILSTIDLPQEKVEVPEWGGTVLVQGLTAAEFNAIQRQFRLDDSPEQVFQNEEFWLMLVERCCINEDGRPLFREGDTILLKQKSARAIMRVFDVAQRLCGFATEAAVADAKNDSATPTSGSVSDSPSA
jgi:hypothetical protein